jgi:hypothetical protein
MSTQLLKLVFFVPATHLDVVKEAVFKAGAGRQGNYEHCCWQVLGQGQFRPMAGSAPFLGELGTLESVTEYRVEILCPTDCAVAVKRALVTAHPYEEPAFEFVPLIQI